MYLFVLGLALVLEVFLYDLLVGILPQSVDVITAGPKPAAPKHPFDLRVEPEYFLCGDTLDRSHYLFRSIGRNALHQKMNAIPVKADLQKMNFVPLLYPKTDFLESGRNRIIKNLSTMFNRTNKMIKQQTLVMAFVNMFAHNHKNTCHYATPEAEPRGIL